MDYVGTSLGDIVLVRDRAHGTGVNGLYRVTAGAWEKIAPDAGFINRNLCIVFISYGRNHFESAFVTASAFETTRGLGAYFKDVW